MAVEDGAILGLLLARVQRRNLSPLPTVRNAQLTSVLQLYEQLRKQRTEVNVSGAVLTREFYHLPDGESQLNRDRELSELPTAKWQGPSKWNWGDAKYQKSLLGFDVLADAENRFDQWSRNGFGAVISSVL
jgi:salicylate hydroxylase